jgi:hypothetical protein
MAYDSAARAQLGGKAVLKSEFPLLAVLTPSHQTAGSTKHQRIGMRASICHTHFLAMGV